MTVTPFGHHRLMWLAIVSGGVFFAFSALTAIDRAAEVPAVRQIGSWIAVGLCILAMVWNEAFSLGMGRWVDAESDRLVDWFLGSLEDLRPSPDTTDRP